MSAVQRCPPLPHIYIQSPSESRLRVNVLDKTIPHIYVSNFGQDTIYPKFEFHSVSNNEVLKCFKEVTSNAIGPDGIDPKFVRILLPSVLPYITYLFNSILTSSTFPSRWKHAKIIPIPKSNSEFRPIAILCFLSKIFEKIVQEQMSEYLQRNSLLSNVQSGFRAGYSCTTALIEVSESIRCEIDENKICFLVLLYHSKAFDTVDHQNLCFKLRRFFNFSTTSTKLISSYLSNRSQSVYTGTLISKPMAVKKESPKDPSQVHSSSPYMRTIFLINFTIVKHTCTQMMCKYF